MNKIKRVEIVGIIFTIILGTLLHFTYHWSGNNYFVALFSAVNESTWEHLKLLYFPYVVYSILEYYYIGHEYRNYVTAKTLGVIAGLVAIPVIFNFYTSILGNHYFILDIFIFIIGVIFSYAASFYVLNNDGIEFNDASIVIILFIMVLFFVFTFDPPKTKLFIDPITNTYGIYYCIMFG